MAPAMVDVVRFAGGLLVDRVLAGWEATVLVADRADPRPLRILGAAPVDLESALAAPEALRHADELAVQADLWATDDRVRRLARHAASEEAADLRIWGGPGSAELEHRLSFAARAFKARALAAAAAAPVAIDVETFGVAQDLGARALAGAVPGALR